MGYDATMGYHLGNRYYRYTKVPSSVSNYSRYRSWYDEPISSYYGYGSRGLPLSRSYSTIWPVHANYPSYASRYSRYGSSYYDPYYSRSPSYYDSLSTYYGYGRYSGLYSPYTYTTYYKY